MGQCNSSDENELFCMTLVVVAASSEALALLTKVSQNVKEYIVFFACRYTVSETLSVSVSSLATIWTVHSRALGGSEIFTEL